ncbi:hypothetical protein [Bacillus pseudomycoides]
MNLSVFDELELFFKELQRYMSPDDLEQLAREIGFLKHGNHFFVFIIVIL